MKPKEIRLEGCWLDEALIKYPEASINHLQWCVEHDLTNEILRKWPPWLFQRVVLQRDWIDAIPPLTLQEAYRLLQETDDPVERMRIELAAGRRGRPIKLRKPAIQARMLREYVGMEWKEIAQLVCPRDGLYTPEEILPCLQRVERLLKRLLVDCNIELPDEPMGFVHGDVIRVEGHKQWVKLENGEEVVISTEKPRQSGSAAIVRITVAGKGWSTQTDSQRKKIVTFQTRAHKGRNGSAGIGRLHF
jgi:hypothetical protein